MKCQVDFFQGAQAGIKISGRNINNFRYVADTTLWHKEELKNLLMRVKEESEKAGLKGIWSHHFMANRWVKCGNSDRFYFIGLQNYCEW